MEKLKFVLFSIVVLSLMGILGYWSIITLQSGTENATDQRVKQLEKENRDLKTQVQKQKDELGALQAQLTEQSLETKDEPKQVVYKYQDLMDELQKLVSDNVFLKLKSRGTKVGTLQKFLNIYNNTSNKIDNDYGASTKTAVMAFQKDQGMTADGEAGPSTFSKMIDWLKK